MSSPGGPTPDQHQIRDSRGAHGSRECIRALVGELRRNGTGFEKTAYVCVSWGKLCAFDKPSKHLPGLTQVSLSPSQQRWGEGPPAGHSEGPACPRVAGVFPDKPADRGREHEGAPLCQWP